MSNCEWKKTLDADDYGRITVVCVKCGSLVKTISGNPKRKCSSSKSPGLFGRVTRYATSLMKWIESGRPVREDSDVDRIYLEICMPCESFQNGKCAKCGCRVNIGKKSAFNKIRMATENCPDGKW